MGLAQLLLGENNPFTSWVNDNRNFLTAIGSGLGQGQNIQGGLSAGMAMLPQARQLDQAAQEKRKADELAEQQKNATLGWLKQNHPDIAMAVQQGIITPGEGFMKAFELDNAKQDAANAYTLRPGETRFAPDGSVLASLPAADDTRMPTPPSGYRWNKDGTALEFVPGGPADPAVTGKGDENTNAYPGSSVEATDLNTVLAAVHEGKTDTLEYAVAYKRLFAPREETQLINGQLAVVTTQPPIPDGIPQPTYAAPPAQAPAPQAQAPAPAPVQPPAPAPSLFGNVPMSQMGGGSLLPPIPGPDATAPVQGGTPQFTMPQLPTRMTAPAMPTAPAPAAIPPQMPQVPQEAPAATPQAQITPPASGAIDPAIESVLEQKPTQSGQIMTPDGSRLDLNTNTFTTPNGQTIQLSANTKATLYNLKNMNLDKQTEGQVRIGMLAASFNRNIPLIQDNFAVMGSTPDNLAKMLKIADFANVGLEKLAQSQEYKLAQGQLTESMMDVLYALSGAAATDSEVERNFETFVPAIGDGPVIILDKWRRFVAKAQDLAMGAKDPALIAAAQKLAVDYPFPDGIDMNDPAVQDYLFKRMEDQNGGNP